MTERDPVVYNDRYELQRRVGRGGMAQVYLAKDLLLARPVAVKVLFPELSSDPSFVARFRREAQAAANLNHPNIVGVYDWGKEDGTYYIVMEYVEGRTLSDILKTEKTIDANRAAMVGFDVAAALAFAHRNGVVHRDIKPGNVLISPQGKVKVADFGIARAITAGSDENLTQTGSVMGTATYFSPEQAQGHAVDPRSDLYSLGVVLYEMVTGQPPFSGDSPVAIAYKHVQEQPRPVRALNPNVPPAFEAIVMKLLAKDPAQRYATGDDLRADLKRFRQGQRVAAPAPAPAPAPVAPVAAPAPSQQYDEVRVGSSRRTGWFVLVLVLLLAVLGGLVFAFAQTLGVTDSAKIEVPDVVGQNSLVAIAKLKDAGFEVETAKAPSPDRPQDEVIDQSPAGGTRQAKGSTVRLTISTGADTATLPDVKCKSRDDAINELKAAGFSVITALPEESNDCQDGQVVRQSPLAGSSYAKNQPVQIFVRSGPVTTTTESTTTTETPTTSKPTTTTTKPTTTTSTTPTSSSTSSSTTL